MKKITIILAALAASFAVSCTKEAPEAQLPQDQNAPAGMKQVTITASIDGADTKTSYDAAGKFSWTKGDKIAIKGSDNQFYTFATTETAASATFTGYMPEGVSLQKHALYPAESAVKDASDGYFYTIPEYKDLTGGFSADIPMSSYVSAGKYEFKHMAGAVLLTFTNIPDGVNAVEVSIKANKVRLSGTQQVWSGTPFTFTAAEAANDSEKTFTRKLSVVDNQVKLYLPYKGGFWDSCTINILGYYEDGSQFVLLKDKAMRGTSANDLTPGLVIPYKPLELPDYVNFSKLDWESAQISYDLPASASSSRQVMKEAKVIADNKFVYARIKSSKSKFEDTGSNYLGFYLYDAIDGSGNGYWEWWGNSKGNTEYEGEQDGSFEAGTANLAMNFNGTSIVTNTEVSDDDVYWYMAFPRSAHELLSSPGSVYIAFILNKDWSQTGALPDKYGSMFEVTLP